MTQDNSESFKYVIPSVKPSQESASAQPEPVRKKEKFDYRKQLRQDFTRMISELDDLSPQQQDFLRLRWLDQVLWMEGKAGKEQKRYYWLRLITIIGGVLVPAFISLGTFVPTIRTDDAQTVRAENIQTNSEQGVSENIVEFIIVWSPLLSFVLSQAVAITAAIEQFYKSGERWRNYRRSAELLKSQGWQFFQLSGTYSAYADETGQGHRKAFPDFAGRIEEIIYSDVEGYISQIAQPKASKQDVENKEQK